ncbi:MAG: hypothetical protein ACE5LS_04520 [Thermoplasmata archaeon]
MMAGGPREFLLQQIESGVGAAPPDVIADWIEGKMSIVDILFEPNREFLRTFKDQALEVLRGVSGADIRDACLRAAPHLADVWYSPVATARFEGEIAIMTRFVREL